MSVYDLQGIKMSSEGLEYVIFKTHLLRYMEFMKNLPLILCFLASPVLACPELKGTYTQCTSWKGILDEVREFRVREYPQGRTKLYRFTTEASDQIIPANRIQFRTEDGTLMSAACLGNLLQVRTPTETSQYYKHGEKLVRISRGTLNGERYTDILTCQ